MDKKSLIIRKLSIFKMPGLKKGRKIIVADNSPNVNVIYGENASGKTTTGRIIKQTIWPKDTAGLEFQSELNINQEQWNVSVDHEKIVTQKQGVNAHLPISQNEESNNRYVLDLKSMLIDEDADLAQKIIQESIGGINFNATTNNLLYSDKIAGSGITEKKDLDTIQEKEYQIRQQQEKLKDDESRLAILKEEKEKAEKAEKVVVFMNDVKSLIEAKLKCKQISKEMEAFPKELHNLKADDYDNLQELENELDEIQYAIKDAQNKITSNTQTISNLTLSKDSVSTRITSQIKARLERIKDIENELKKNKNDSILLKEKENQLLDNIGIDKVPEEWECISIQNLQELEELARKLLTSIGKINGLKEHKNQLQQQLRQMNEMASSSEDLSKGILYLKEWLGESGDGKEILPKANIGFVIILCTLIGASITAGLFLNYFFFLGLALTLIIPILLKKKTLKTSSSTFQDKYKKLELDVPQWTTDGVGEELIHLMEQQHELEVSKKLNLQIEQKEKELNDLSQQYDQLEKSVNDWRDKLKGIPEIEKIKALDVGVLIVFFGNLIEWQKANADRKGKEKVIQATKIQLAEELKKMNDTFLQLGFDTASDYATGRGVFDTISEENEIIQKAISEISHAQSLSEDKMTTKEKIVKKKAAILQRLNCNEGEEGKILELTNQFEQFNVVATELNDENRSMNKLTSNLESHSLYPTYKDTIFQHSIDEVEDIIRTKNKLVEKAKELQNSIVEIETKIRIAKEGNSLEQALSKREHLVDELMLKYDKNLSSITGDLIITLLKEETQSKNQSVVLRKADTIFSTITNGNYQLKVDNTDTPAFLAIDSLSNQGLELNELSAGTRIQLLLAVRLAFIEEQETECKLPLVIDELLANSDDIRGVHIIEALLKISASGRQLFYFTAQSDEVIKWKTHADKHKGIKFKIHTISSKQLDVSTHQAKMQDIEKIQFLKTIPQPNSNSYEQYAKEIEIPSYNLLTHNSDAIHLWYLMDDPQLLYQCLSQRVNYWGQLKTFLKLGEIQGLANEMIQNMEGKVTALNHFQELYKRGRPLPIDREVLVKSGAVSTSFIEEVDVLLKKLNGNPVQLLHALNTGKVAKFRSNKIEELEEYLIREDFIDEREALEMNAILVQMNGVLSTLSVASKEIEELLNRIIQQ